MGGLRNIRETAQLREEITRAWDPTQQRRDGIARMAAAHETITQTTHTANIAAAGIDATATVTSSTQTGTMLDTEPLIELSLMVIPARGMAPYEATITQPITQLLLPLVRVGSRLAVKVDPSDPQSIWIDFATERA
jgi:hypothetical protein